MVGYLLRRVIESIPVLIGITLVAFVLLRFVPGDPAIILLGPRATDEAVATLRDQLGLDQSIFVQYAVFIRDIFTLELGTSIVHRTEVGSLLAPRLARTLGLLGFAVVIALIVAVPLAIVSAVRRNRFADHSIRIFSTVTFAMPGFWLGTVLVLLFSLKLGIFPTSGLGSTPAELIRSLTLPALTIGLYLAPLLLRSLRSSVIENLGMEFTEAARARGLAERRILMKHVLKNSLSAMITVLGVNLGFLLSTSVVIENVFAIPGVGSLLVSSIVARDFPVVQGLTLVFGVLVIAVNLLVDLAYAALDPRVRL